MNKKELVHKIAESTDLSKAEAGRILQSTMETITDTLSRGDKVTLVGFGTFSVNNWAARTGRNPQNGDTVKIPPRKVAKFKPGKRLSETIGR